MPGLLAASARAVAWSDAQGGGSIVVREADGSARRIVASPNALAVDEERIYWTDRDRSEVRCARINRSPAS